MRGFKKDAFATSQAEFRDKRSFVSMPKLILGDGPEKPHLLLYGKDKSDMRKVVFDGQRYCGLCGFEFTDSEQGEWDHIRTKSGQRCDCLSNSRRVHRSCHEARHSDRKPWAEVEA